jgi:alkylation response protein AidB-like acyl-CoA dehydrogenase
MTAPVIGGQWPGAEDFPHAAREWLQEYAPPRRSAHAAEVEVTLSDQKRFQAALYDAGFAGIDWPASYGGRGLSMEERMAFAREAEGYELLTEAFNIGMGMVGPTLLELGTELQKERYIKPLLRGEEIWCQLFSEPGAGSDVASLQTRALRTEGGWVVNGQKVWTSGAQHADWGIVLARTDATKPRHQGITMLIVDMHHPGVTVRPLKVATGESQFNEVFFDDVLVPPDAVVGDVDRGWEATFTMLRHERTYIATTPRVVRQRLSIDLLMEAAWSTGRAEQQSVRDSLMSLYVLETCRSSFGRWLQNAVVRGQETGARGSIGKLATAISGQAAVDVALEILGSALAGHVAGTPAHSLVVGLLESPVKRLAGGTDEIQRNIIAERLLGLPKDPGTDRTTPFNQLRVGTLQSHQPAPRPKEG